MPPAPQAYRPTAPLLALGEPFYDPVAAADFPETILRFRNDRAAAEIGLETLGDAEWVARLARFAPLPGTLPEPLAMRYHGHQFRSYNPDIGDGRGFTFAQLLGTNGLLYELGTKGSGQTPWSRFGDGRLTLKGGVREILATEMLEALGVPTSRTLSLVETGEALDRGDEPSPTRSAVLVRMSRGHIRIGTFQKLAYNRDADAMRRLVDYCLGPLGIESIGDGSPAVRLLGAVAASTGRLAASFLIAGFVHGVLNSDNINVTGESFDYGPWRFAPTWDDGFTAAYFDRNGLYAFGRQPEAIRWDVAQLAVSLRQLEEAEPLIAALEGFDAAFRTAFVERLTWRLGVTAPNQDSGWALGEAVVQTLRATRVPIDSFFVDARGGVLPERYGSEWSAVREALAAVTPAPGARDHPYFSPYFSDAEPCSMLIDEVEAIWSAIDKGDDWEPLHAKVAAIRRMGEAFRT